jgi:tetratricopeptide (TPR) repeat protein
MAEVYLEKQNAEAGPEAVERQKSAFSLDQEANRTLAEYYMERKQYARAIPHFKRVVKPDDVIYVENNWDFCLKLADAYLGARQVEEAIAYLRKLLAFFPDEGALLRRMGEACFRRGEADKAAEYFREALKRNPSDGESIVSLAKLYFRSDRTRKDIPELFEKAILMNPASAEAEYNYGVYLSEIGEYNVAAKHFQKALKIRPFHSPSIARLGMVYYYQGKIREAEEMYELALSINPTDYNTWYNLGELRLTSLNRAAEAFDAFQKALEYDKDHFFALKKCGVISLNNRNYKEACVFFDRAYEVRNRTRELPREVTAFDQEIVDVLILYATALESLGRKADAIQKLSMALAENPLDRVARHKLSLLQQSG